MKRKVLFFLFIIISLGATAQKEKQTGLYTLCGKQGIGTIIFTVDEFKQCKKELLPVIAGDKIVSFIVSIQVNGNFTDLQVNGNYSPEYNSLLSMTRTGEKIVIEKVRLMRDNKTISAPGVIIEIK